MNRLLALLLLASLALAGCGKSPDAKPGGDPGGGRKPVIAFLPKSRGNAYFVSCKKGADKAAKAGKASLHGLLQQGHRDAPR